MRRTPASCKKCRVKKVVQKKLRKKERSPSGLRSDILDLCTIRMNAGCLVFIALTPVVHQRLPAGFRSAMFFARPIRALLLGTLVLFPGLGRPCSHGLSRLAHVPLSAVDLPAGASSPSAECGIPALAEILRNAFSVSRLVALRRSRLPAAALLAASALAASLLIGRPSLALLRLTGPTLSVLSLPLLPAWFLSVFALFLGPHGCVGAAGALPSIIPPSFLLRVLLRLAALVMASFLLLISHLGLFLLLCGFTWHFVLSFYCLPSCCSENAGEAIG
jgi:hypothetical protein